MRIAYWIPVILLTLLLAVIGLRYGIQRQGLTETDVITLYAQRYLADHAGSGRPAAAQVTDCFAHPGSGAWSWLVVTCRPKGGGAGEIYRYEVNVLGGLIGFSGPDTAGLPQPEA
ncbi:hypothetical protein [Phycobacter sp. K97]|uniref:hypothetical protein n=1 Tax=Phycobacter sedimenti TaxID=3133977 RepID=UPI00311D6D43